MHAERVAARDEARVEGWEEVFVGREGDGDKDGGGVEGGVFVVWRSVGDVGGIDAGKEK